MRAVTISVSIGCPAINVYDFVSDPGNLPAWAKEFARAVKRASGEWLVETATGQVKIRFIAKNDYEILDHYVTSADGIKTYVPMRVVPNGIGSEVMLTLFQQPYMTDKEFASDAQMVERDLKSLKTVMERSCAVPARR